MRTMLELLVRLNDMRCCCERVELNPQLTAGEKAAACTHKQIFRECLPPQVLAHYDQMKETEPTLVQCPEIFAMAVLVSTWRSLSPAGRRKLETHFAITTPTPDEAQDKGRTTRRTSRLAKTAGRQAGRRSSA